MSRERRGIERIDDLRWRIPRTGQMRTTGLVFADERMMADIEGDQALDQVANVAHLPGIVGPSMAMPDVHWGYGFPIGGVAAFDPRDGVISPGGVGYDINCGVRVLSTPLTIEEVRPKLAALVDGLYAAIPSGIGSARSDVALSAADMDGVLRGGARWAVSRGFGVERDLECIEAGGKLPDADPRRVSPKARKRGRKQLGTLGSGNHFAEIGYVAERFDEAAADALGLHSGSVTVMIHSGSRGLGHQVCDDYLDVMVGAAARYGIDLPDRQLCCAPLSSPEARRYWGAMNAAANYAFGNRQLMAHFARQAFAHVFGRSVARQMDLVYDVAHNIAKMERHEVAGERRTVCVHRKGATRAFPPGHAELAPRFQVTGQPVLIPGDMGRYSYVLVGAPGAVTETFGSCCHGAGRRLSRHAAKKVARKRDIAGEMERRGVIVRAASRATVLEEIPEAYKDVAHVVEVVHRAGLARKVAQLRPVGVVKG